MDGHMSDAAFTLILGNVHVLGNRKCQCVRIQPVNLRTNRRLMIGNLQFSGVCDNLDPAGVSYFSLHQFQQLGSLVAYSCIVVDELPSPPKSWRPVSNAG